MTQLQLLPWEEHGDVTLVMTADEFTLLLNAVVNYDRSRNSKEYKYNKTVVWHSIMVKLHSKNNEIIKETAALAT